MRYVAKPQTLCSFRSLQHPRWLKSDMIITRKIKYQKDFFQQNRNNAGHIDVGKSYWGLKHAPSTPASSDGPVFFHWCKCSMGSRIRQVIYVLWIVNFLANHSCQPHQTNFNNKDVITTLHQESSRIYIYILEQ